MKSIETQEAKSAGCQPVCLRVNGVKGAQKKKGTAFKRSAASVGSWIGGVECQDVPRVKKPPATTGIHRTFYL